MKKKLPRISVFKKAVWKICSEFIRKRDCPNGVGRCFTCLVTITYSECDAGHWIHGNTKATWLLEENIHAQCKRCNLYLSGNGTIYTLKMIDLYGREKCDELIKLSKTEHVFNRKELQERLEYYQKKLSTE